MWSHLQPAVKGMFWHTFHHDGDRYGKRPSAEEWLKAFQGYKRWLASGNNFDPMSNDVYPTRYRASRDQRRGRAGPGDLLDDDGRGDRVGAAAAVGHRDVHGLQVPHPCRRA